MVCTPHKNVASRDPPQATLPSCDTPQATLEPRDGERDGKLPKLKPKTLPGSVVEDPSKRLMV